jgi:8-oxo-dGTP pyrophosphatase MutT (NUDIX family)
MDLSTIYLGLKLPHPVIVGASPLVDHLDTAKRELAEEIGKQAEHWESPTQSRAELQRRRRQWDKTSEVPAVHGALHWWALSRAVKPHS